LVGQTSNKQDDVNNGLNVVSDEISQAEREENVKQLVSDCRKLLVDQSEDCYGSWALINVTEYEINDIKLMNFHKIFYK